MHVELAWSVPSCTCVHVTSRLYTDWRTRTRVRRSLKDAGNVTEAELTTSPLLLLVVENSRPRAPDLIRVDDDVRQTNDESRLRRRRNTSLSTTPGRAGPSRRVAGGHVSSGRRPPPPSRRGTCRSFQSSSTSSSAAAVMMSRWTTTLAARTDFLVAVAA